MSSTVEVLVLDLLEWVARADRSYDETMEAWRTSCPRLPVWEEATDRGLVTIELVDNLPRVRVTPVGLEWLTRCRPQQSDQVVKPAVLDSRTSRR